MARQQTPIAVLHEQYRQHMEAEDAFEDALLRETKKDTHDQKSGLLLKRRLALQESIPISRAVTPQDALCQMAQISIEMDWLTGCHHTAEHMSTVRTVIFSGAVTGFLGNYLKKRTH